MTKLEGLGERLAREQDVLRERLASGRAEVRERLAAYVPSDARRARRIRYAAGAGALLAAAAAALVWYAETRAPKLELRAGASNEPVLPGAWVEAPPQASAGGGALQLAFSDGSRLELMPRTRVRVIDVDEHGAHLLLESGQVHVAVVPRAEAAFRLSVGPFTVRVVGTRFDVRFSPDDDAFGLALTDGEVALSGCVFGSDYRVRVGQAVDASCRRGLLQLRKLSDPPLSLASAVEPSEPAVAPEPAAAPEPEPSAPPERAPSRAKEPRPSSRAAGPIDEASQEEQELLLIRRRHAGSPRAAVAAFALGRLEFDERHAHAKAAQWFGTYLKEAPSGSLAREARGRLMEATLASGDRDRARALAAEYLAQHPTGPHAALARSLSDSP